MHKLLFLLMTMALSFFAFSDHHEVPSSEEGAFTTLMVAAPNVDRYVDYLKADTSLFKTIGSTGAGVCVTNSGNDYPGQMLVWNAFPNFEAALGGAAKYDPSKAPSSLARLREVKYSVSWKPLKAFRLEPGYERVQRIKVPAANVTAFTEVLTRLEKAIQDAGHKNFFNGIFTPIGGGVHETGTYMVRSITPDGAQAGAIFDDYFSGAAWGSIYQEGVALIDGVVSDNIEICEQFYYGE
ncbi:MAG: hypothetical protein MK371_02140 [SAR86 cluster bacterium]|jgi:hypothetical protein|nr:hypothetical protein [SAR86 cluster bacterium]